MDTSPNSSDNEQRLATLRGYGILDTERERDYDDLCRLAAQICEAPMALITFVDAERQWFKSEVGVGMTETPLPHSFCRHAILEQEMLLIPDMLLDERFCLNPFCVEAPKVRFYAGAVIRASNGDALGTVCVLDMQPRELRPSQIDSLAVLARQTMSMLERRRAEAFLTLQSRFALLRADLSARMGSPEPLKAILQHCAEQLMESFRLSSAQIWTLSPENDELCLEAVTGFPADFNQLPSRIAMGESTVGRIAKERRAFLNNDVLSNLGTNGSEGAGSKEADAFAGYPLVVADRLLGVLALFAQHPFTEMILEELKPIVDGIAQCIDRKQTDETLRRKEHVSSFLAKASAELAELVDFQSTLQKIAGVAVPDFADWCMVDLLDAQGNFQRLAAAHQDPAKVEFAHAFMLRFPPQQDDAAGMQNVCRTGNSEWISEISGEALALAARSPEHLDALRELGFKSSIIVPLKRREVAFGAITFGITESNRRFNASDLKAAEDLASRAAVTTESASLYQKLKLADQRKDEFLATLAHELRNPLAPLRNALQMLQLTEPDPAAFATMRDLMVRQLTQMVRLIDDLLDVSRITRNRLDLRKERVRLSQIVLGAVETSRPLIDAAGHELIIRLPSAEVELDADPARLTQVLSNLLNNAAKYTKPKGCIWLEAELDDQTLIVEVRDNGVGISAEMLAVVFDMFTQIGHSMGDSQGGLGIGLTLVRRLVAMHGGFVEAHSPGLGHGSRFVVRLPIGSVNLRSLESSAGGQPDSVSSAPDAMHRILVVDDNRDSAVTLAKLLKLLGHELHVAFDGQEAVESAAKLQPSVILLDIGMPKLNGYEAARIIRKEAKGRPLLLIAMTGWGQEEDLRRATEAGFDHHLLKPVDYAELKKLLATAR